MNFIAFLLGIFDAYAVSRNMVHHNFGSTSIYYIVIGALGVVAYYKAFDDASDNFLGITGGILSGIGILYGVTGWIYVKWGILPCLFLIVLVGVTVWYFFVRKDYQDSEVARQEALGCIKSNPVKAFKAYERGVEGTDSSAVACMIGLAECYELGIGTEKNEKKAREFYIRAYKIYKQNSKRWRPGSTAAIEFKNIWKAESVYRKYKKQKDTAQAKQDNMRKQLQQIMVSL